MLFIINIPSHYINEVFKLFDNCYIFPFQIKNFTLTL